MNFKERTRRKFFVCLVVALAIPAAAQKPSIFDVSEVVVGAQRIPTLQFYAVGKWSDAGDHVGALSTQIQCYKALGFCDVASAMWNGEASVNLTSFDILRWDSQELIAVDSSPTCVMNTLRADLIAKRVTLSSTDKGVTNDKWCKEFSAKDFTTAVLWGEEDVIKDQIEKMKTKK